MWKKILKIIAKVFIFTYLFLCVKDCFGLFYWRMSHLSDEELEWITLPSTTPKKFVSSTGEPMKVEILRKGIANSTNPIYFSYTPSDEYEAMGLYNIHCTSAKYNCDGKFFIIKTFDSIPLQWTGSLKNFYVTWSAPVDPQAVKINGVELNDCLIADSINSHATYQSNKSEPNVDKFIISKQYGLVYFRFNDGTEFFPKFKDRPDAPAVLDTPNDSID